MSTFKVGLVGCGHISVTHLKSWRTTPGCAVSGLFDLDQELAQKRQRDFNIPTIYETLEELIDACDVIDVCTPPQTHSKIAAKVIAAGKRLIIEKPLVTDVADWDTLVSQLGPDNRDIAVIHNLKYANAIQQAKRWVDAGRIGKIIRIQREFLTSPATDRMLVGNSHWSHKLPGGRWFETLPHELYLTHYFAGPLQLDAVTATRTANAPAGAPADEVMISLKSKSCLATIHFSANCDQNRRVFTVQGEKGTITVDILSDFATLTTVRDSRWQRAVGRPLLSAAGVVWQAIADRLRYGLDHIRGISPHTNLIRVFGLYIQGDGPAPTPFAEVDYVVRNCDLIGREIDRQVAVMRG